MLIPPCGRSISPCLLSAEKSRARFFAPLRCAQNDSMAGFDADEGLARKKRKLDGFVSIAPPMPLRD